MQSGHSKLTLEYPLCTPFLIPSLRLSDTLLLCKIMAQDNGLPIAVDVYRSWWFVGESANTPATKFWLGVSA